MLFDDVAEFCGVFLDEPGEIGFRAPFGFSEHVRIYGVRCRDVDTDVPDFTLIGVFLDLTGFKIGERENGTGITHEKRKFFLCVVKHQQDSLAFVVEIQVLFVEFQIAFLHFFPC